MNGIIQFIIPSLHYHVDSLKKRKEKAGRRVKTTQPRRDFFQMHN